MRSTEASGVGAIGLNTTEDALMPGARPDPDTPMPRRFFGTSWTSLAIAVTSLLAAGLFVTFDAVRTLEEARQRLQLMTRVVAAELSPLGTDGAAIALLRSAPQHDKALVASLRDPLGQVIATTSLSLTGDAQPKAATTDEPQSLRAELGDTGILDMRLDEQAALRGVWQRGTAAFGLAFLMIGVSYRRDATVPPTRAQRKGFETLIATMPFGVACWTREGDLMVCNDLYKTRLNVRDKDARPGASYHAAVKGLVLGGYVRLVREDEGNRLLEFHRQDGSILLIDERPLRDGEFVTLVTDVTERKRADLLLNSIREEQRLLARRYHEEKLKAEAASRSKTTFLAHLSHDIRTPLNHMIGFAELLRHQTYGPLGDKRYLGYADTIKESGERLLASFATILELAELESGRRALREEPVTIDALLATIADRFRPQAMRAGVGFAIKSPCDATLMADRFCLERMLGNIVENAIRFTRAGGKVTLGAFAASDGVVLEITDTGIGMSEEKLATLSQPFVFGDATFTKDTSDSGLGIAIARAIAELSGGRLAIDSSPALGTTVAISLPLRAMEAEQAA